MQSYWRFFTILLIFLGLLTAASIAGSAPPTGRILGKQGSNTEGTHENPFSGTGISLLLEIEDADGGSYHVVWLAGWGGSFCTNGTFQWFGVEHLNPTLGHPPGRSGVALITISAVINDGENNPVEVKQTFFVVPREGGCDVSLPPPGGGLRGLSLLTDPTIADLGETVTLSASAEADEDSLTFLFYTGSSAQAAVRGDLFATKAASGCRNRCSAQATFKAANFPTTHFFMFEVRDSGNEALSTTRAVQVKEGGDGSGGGGTGGDNPPEDNRSWTTCQDCGSQVSAGPPSVSVEGGKSLALVGDVIAPKINGLPMIGTFQWEVIDDGGLGTGLKLLNAPSLKATLQTPNVDEDVEIRLGFGATYESCTCIDELVVTILADSPPKADLKLSVSGPAKVDVGGEVSFEVEVSNQGPDSTDDVTLTGIVPSGMTYRSSASNRGTCSVSGTLLTCRMGRLNMGQSGTATFKLVAEQAGDTVFNASVVGRLEDPTTANNEVQAITSIEDPGVDLALALSGPEQELRVGGDLVYVLTVDNLTSSPANDVVLRNTLPEQVEFIAADASQGVCSFTPSKRQVLCSLGMIPGHGQVVVSLFTRPMGPGQAVNSATVGGREIDSEPSNNLATLKTNVIETVADMAVSLTGVPEVSENELVTYSVLVTNLGPEDAGAVTLTASIPEGLVAPAASPGKGSCVISSEEIECLLGSMTVGEEVEVVITGTAVGAGILLNTVEVISGEKDPDLDNNSDTAETIVASLHFTLVPHSLGLPNTFIGLAIVNLSGGPNSIEIEAVDRQGVPQAVRLLDSNIDLRQEARLTTQFFEPGEVGEEDTLIARGVDGEIRSFFMMGTFDVRKIDGVGADLPDGKTLFYPLAQNWENGKATIFLFNPKQEAVSDIVLELFEADGDFVESSTISLAARGSFKGSLAEVFGDHPLEEGYVRVTTPAPLRGFQLLDDGSNFASVTARPGDGVRRLTVPHYVNFSDSTSILRVLNVGSGRVGGTVEAFDDLGESLGKASIEIDVAELGVFDLQKLFDPEALGNTGYLKLNLSSGTVGVFEASADVVAVVAYRGETFHAALPMMETGHRRTFFLHVAQEGTNFHGLAILNSGEETASGTVEIYNADGEITGQADFSLSPGQRVVDLLTGDVFFGPGFSQVQGHIQVKSDQPVIAFALFGGPGFLAAIEGQGVDEPQ